LRIRGVSAMNAGAKTLVLGGASTMENVVWDVTDGEGTVSVEKRGSGSWTLGGASSFSGNLTVKEGTLIVRNDKGAPYKWFKLVIKETASSNPELKPGLTFTDQIGLVEWGLYDGEGRRVNKITNSADGYDLPFETLRPAQIAFTGKPAWVNGDKNAGTYRGATELVDGTWDSLDIRVKYGVAPSLDSPETWMPIVMRLADEAGIVRYYDLFNGDMAYLNRYVTAYTIEGSTDGYSWEEVCSTNGAVTASTKQGWLTGGGEFGDRPGKGIEIRGTGTNDCCSLSAVANVTVASGATLKAVGEIELSSLTVDCASGAGTIEGFSLAASGELRVVNAPRYGCDLPLEFKNARGIANLKQWRVDADGNMDRMELSVGADGKVRLRRKGFLLLCR
jgi:autotransporter-associated beta strand protein